MAHWIFSLSINIEPEDGVRVIRDCWLEKIDQLRSEKGGPIYLCGGGTFAGWLLNQDRIDQLKLKLSPIIFGHGIPLFSGADETLANFDLTAAKTYKSGVVLLEYERAKT